MVTMLSLWLPILLAAVLVFGASALIHMVLGYHAGDYARIPDEDRVMGALAGVNLPPGDYAMPHASGMKAMQSPEYLEKVNRGPVAFITVRPNGPPTMGKQLALWFLYCLVVGGFVAYVTGRALGPGEAYLSVFRIAGTTALIAYVVGVWQTSIWYGRKWSTTLKDTLDGVIFALLTAGVFGWLWPG